jgi:Zn-dependent M28 family amino/carboxypeptidase
MDNASGIAAMLEVATKLHETGAKPARSILFLAVTGEEKGELGSRYFAAHPPVPRESTVADVNIDMFLPLFPLKMLMVLGLDESDLGNDVRATAKAVGATVQADPNRSATACPARSACFIRRASRRWR